MDTRDEVTGAHEVTKSVAAGCLVYLAGRALLRTAARGVVQGTGLSDHQAAAKLMCLCHSVASPVLGAVCAARIHATPSSEYTPLPLLTRVVWWEIGYYILDMGFEVAHAMRETGFSILALGFHIHHIVPLIGAYTYTYWRAAGGRLRTTDWVTGCLLLQNSSTVFQHLLWWMGKLKVAKGGTAYRGVLSAFFTSFIALRLFGLLYLMKTFSAMTIAEAPDLDGGAVASIQHGWSLMPWRCRASVAVLTALNAVWLGINVKNKVLARHLKQL